MRIHTNWDDGFEGFRRAAEGIGDFMRKMGEESGFADMDFGPGCCRDPREFADRFRRDPTPTKIQRASSSSNSSCPASRRQVSN